MKNVLVLVHDDPGQEARLQAAFDLTRACEGHLTCLDVAMMPPTVTDYELTSVGTLLMQDEVQAERENRARIEPRVVEEEIPFTWTEVTGDPAVCLSEAAGLSDVIVVNGELADRGYPDMFAITSELIASGRAPVLAVPESSRGFDPHGVALVAWDGSRDAEAALKAALPMLAMARSVTLFYVEDGSIKVPATEAAAWLSRHGIHPVVRQEAGLFDKPWTVILAEARLTKADYIVMGGFSRARWMEAAFGGATRSLLRECPVPLFIAHR